MEAKSHGLRRLNAKKVGKGCLVREVGGTFFCCFGRRHARYGTKQRKWLEESAKPIVLGWVVPGSPTNSGGVLETLGFDLMRYIVET